MRPQRPHGERSEAGRRYSLLLLETAGTEDYKNVEAGELRPATDAEISTGGVPEGASLLRVISNDGDREQTLLTAASKKETVTVTEGTVNITYDAGATVYKFGGGSSGGMNVVSRTGNVVHENSTYYGKYDVVYTVSSYTGTKTGVVCYWNAGTNRWMPVNSDTSSRTYYYGYQKSTMTVTGVDIGSGSATLSFTPNAPSGGGGTIKYVESVKEATEQQKYGYFVMLPSSGEKETRTFLVQGGVSVQNFAFDGMEDFDYEVEV